MRHPPPVLALFDPSLELKNRALLYIGPNSSTRLWVLECSPRVVAPEVRATSRPPVANANKAGAPARVARACYGMWWPFFSRPRRVPPFQQTDLHTDQRATDSSNGGLGLGRSYSLFGQATETVDVCSNWVLRFFGMDGVADLTDPFSPADGRLRETKPKQDIHQRK